MAAFIDLQVIDGLGLPYAIGAEAALDDPALDPLFDIAWHALLIDFPGFTLQPLFDALPLEQLEDIVDAVRFGGQEPPDPFLWFTLPCDDAVADALATAVQELPMVAFAGQRSRVFPAVSYGTNPDNLITLQVQPAPNGVDAIYAWDVAGGAGEGARVLDVEAGWRLDHDELVSARIHERSVFGVPSARDVDHGTAVAGIVVGADNGVGTIGMVPDATLELVTDDRGGVQNLAAAITVATASLQSGDVMLLEEAQQFFPTDTPDILVEFDLAVQIAITLAVKRGITVIEPAGNGGIDLDAFPFLAHTRPDSPTFSGAIVVGAGELAEPALDRWTRTFSSFGSRVDCFAAGSRIQAPASSARDAYQSFGGTSGASAIVAGAAASLQSMTRAATGATLAPEDVRRLFRSAALGLLPEDPLGARIGPMPDLRKIIHAQGLVRVLPVGVAAIGLDALFMVQLDAENRMVRRHFTLLTGWGSAIPSDSPNDTFALTAAQPAILSAEETAPLPRLRHDAFVTGPGGIHHMFWDSHDQSGDVSTPIAGVGVAAQGRALTVSLPLSDRLLIAAIDPQGHLVVMTGDPQVLLAGLTPPLVLDPVASYRRVAGPVSVSRSEGTADIIVIEDGGSLHWYTGNLPATIGSGFSGPVTEPTGTRFEPGARPALVLVGDKLLSAAVGSEGWLQVCEIDPAAGSINAPVVVDVQATIDTAGPVALALAGGNVVVLGVDTERVLRAATRPIAGGDWTPLLALVSGVAVSPLGGVSAVSIDAGVIAIVVGADGVVQSALSVDGFLWSPLLPLP